MQNHHLQKYIWCGAPLARRARDDSATTPQPTRHAGLVLILIVILALFLLLDLVQRLELVLEARISACAEQETRMKLTTER